jgi:hypothetical protein
MYLNLFSKADVTSAAALFAGLCWPFLAGAVIGAGCALIYNALAPLES